MELERAGLMNLLFQLDRCLSAPVEIIICGGAAGIICHGFSALTSDIDLLRSIPKVSQFEAARNEVAQANGLSPDWINDGSKGYSDYLPDGFEHRLVKIENDFRLLTAYALGRVDLFVMKLAAFRPSDLTVIDSMMFPTPETQIIILALCKISQFDSKKAFIMESYLKETGRI